MDVEHFAVSTLDGLDVLLFTSRWRFAAHE
jgi:hypothetical protein